MKVYSVVSSVNVHKYYCVLFKVHHKICAACANLNSKNFTNKNISTQLMVYVYVHSH
jgi:hypothetical protein